jgi:hypothetical protein
MMTLPRQARGDKHRETQNRDAFSDSNFIQTVRSTKTAEGFGSNYGAAGSHSVDRTEPPQAARVLAALYKKYNNSSYSSGGNNEEDNSLEDGEDGLDWLISLVFQDLLDWHNW